MTPSLPARKDWIERLAKACLPKAQQRWIRWHRYRADFQRSLRPTNVFLVGHPKSGNTWLAYMLACILFKDRLSQIRLSTFGKYIPFVHGQDFRIAEYSHLPEPRVFRNERPLFPDLYPKIIYLIRDPRATLVSFYHMYQVMLNDQSITLKSFLDQYIAMNVEGLRLLLTPFPLKSFLDQYIAMNGIFRYWHPGLVRWDRQVLAWTQRAKEDERVRIVKYEDMVANRRRVLEGLVEFVGIPCDKKDLDLAVGRGDFQAMREDEEQHGAEPYYGLRGSGSRFVRRGEVEGWKDEMDHDLAREIEDRFAPAMKAAGYL